MFVLVPFSFFFRIYGSGHTVCCVSSEKIILTGTLQSMFNFRSVVLRNGTSLHFKLRCAAFYTYTLFNLHCLFNFWIETFFCCLDFRIAKEMLIY